CWPADKVLGLRPWAYGRLGLDRSVPECIVHRPLGLAACAEARSLLHGDPGAIRQVPEADWWMDASDLTQFAGRLAHAALNGETITMGSPRGHLVGGTGAIDFVEDAELPRPIPVCDVDEPS